MSSRHAHWGERAKRKPSTSVDVGDRIAVDASPPAVWRRLSDVHAVALCLPGLVPGSLEPLEPNVYKALLEHSAMGMTAHWDLRATMKLSQPEQCLRVVLEGADPKLGMTMDGTATVCVMPAPSGSVLDYSGHIRVEGSLAGVGGPIIRSIVADALDRFVAEVSGRSDEPRKLSPLGRLWAWLRALFGGRGSQSG
jgi:carbon-monoxide dehydrogenase small subunit